MKRSVRMVYLAAMATLAIVAVEQRLTADTPRRVPAVVLAPAASAPGPVGVPGLLLPVVGITKADLDDNYGDSRGARRHTAIDIMAPRGRQVVAVVDGTVLKLHTSRAGGLTLYLADEARERCYYYAHLDAYEAGIKDGVTVRRGDVIGYVGTTGNAPPNRPHLHFGIERLPRTGEWWKGQPMNPYPILLENGIAIAATR